MKKILLVVGLVLCSAGLIGAVHMAYINAGEIHTIYNDTLPAGDSAYDQGYYIFNGSVDLTKLTLYRMTTDSLLFSLEGSLRTDTASWGWTTLYLDTLTADTAVTMINIDTFPVYTVYRSLVWAINDSLLDLQVYLVTHR